jgi:hypothetical protein
MKTLAPASVIAMMLVTGCTPDGTARGSQDLNAALKQAGQNDIVTQGTNIDEILYAHDGLVIWLRHSRENVDAGPVYVQVGKYSAAVYALSDGKCLGAIPVDAFRPPYRPSVHAVGRQVILFESYEFGDIEAIRAGRFEYLAKFHLVEHNALREVLAVGFEARTQEIGSPPIIKTFVPIIMPNGKLLVSEVAWQEAAIGKQNGLKAAIGRLYRWDAIAKRLVLAVDPAATTGPGDSSSPSSRQ